MAPAPPDPSAPTHSHPDHSDASQSQPATRVRRRTRKREGPPQLQFLTATDLSQFKDENAKRSVRSQAMIQYRYKADQQKRKSNKDNPRPESEETSPQSQTSPVDTASSSSISPTSTRPPRNDSFDSATSLGSIPSQLAVPTYSFSHGPMMAEGFHDQHIYPSTTEAWQGVIPDEGFSEDPWFLTQPSQAPVVPAYHDRYSRALSIRPLNTPARRVLEYQETQEHEEAHIRIIVSEFANFRPIGDTVDPFTVLPQFASPELSSVYLVRTCNRAFVSRATIVKWIPVMLSNPHLLLSANNITSTWLDMHAGCSGDSKRTALVKSETIGWINERLGHPEHQFSDATLMVILHLLAGEMWSSNEKTLRIHQTGISRLISLRGGLDLISANGSALAEVSTSCVVHADIICETEPLAMFNNWNPPEVGPLDQDTPMPESPLYCPRSELFTLAQDPRCSELTYGILCDMRDLTDLAIAHYRGLESMLAATQTSRDRARMMEFASQYDAKVAEIQARLADLPSARQPDQSVSNDWVYESCRIAAIIYASAIISRVPFSQAADPGRAIVLSNANMAANGHLMHRRLTEALYEVVERSNMESIWGNMAGTLYWVTAVGAAAGRTRLTINIAQTPSRTQAYAAWIRRCLIMFATRVMLLLIFEHPRSILLAQKRLVKIQEIIAGGATNSRLLAT
ncbi:hypothetical protein BU24DRAFT_409847 [Aaosphaeria arxii CBS 175.79]|uniref:Transcription factor domain-containing protein n=1 Tax=Aaosphaeria arxii CBS 175.79 TaxID=1450172 RepID=A0A6A5XV21_9PLEO|nr:uncharacterized protein BU24DRAFT_409847 [Aaosphaeria arxii CBS 175.79]KAF2016776.1 hypothetical protein BU24DRAFT_409847 [Aaosphaeria arxii CBS 175.79]